jgi:hypothetical protein
MWWPSKNNAPASSELSLLLKGLVSPVAPAPHMSVAARKRISETMKQRWAKREGKTPKKSKARPAMSAATRKKLSALMKVRWAAKKKAKP